MKLVLDAKLKTDCLTCQRCDCGLKNNDFMLVLVDFKSDMVCIFLKDFDTIMKNLPLSEEDGISLFRVSKTNKKKYYRIDLKDGFIYAINANLYKRDLRYEDIMYEFEKWFSDTIGIRYTDQPFNWKKFSTPFMKNPTRMSPVPRISNAPKKG